MRTGRIVKKVIRGLLWLILSLGAVILLVIGLLQLPAVQGRLTGELEQFLSKKLNTVVRVGRIGLDFPKMVTVENFYLETPGGDTLAAFEKLGVDMDMMRLFDKQVRIQKVKLEGISGAIVITDSSSNIQFLLDAFRPVPSVPQPGVKDKAAWTIDFHHITVDLRKADLYYQDDLIGIILETRLDHLLLQTDSIALQQQVFNISNALLEKGDIFLTQYPPAGRSRTGSDSTSADLVIAFKQLTLDRSTFSMASEKLDLSAAVGHAQTYQTILSIKDSFQFESKEMLIDQGTYVMDLPAPPLKKGFDVNHLDLEQIEIELEDVLIRPDSLRFYSRQIRGHDRKGPAIERLTGVIGYSPEGLELHNIDLKTSGSSLTIPEFTLIYPFSEPFTANTALKLEANAKGKIALADLLYIVPALESIELLRQNRDLQIDLDLEAAGDQHRLVLDHLFLDGPGLQLRGRGTVLNALNADKLSGNFQLAEWTVNPEMIIPILPDSLLPPYIQWPQLLKISGEVDYYRDQGDLSLTLEEQRDSTPHNSLVVVTGHINNIKEYPDTEIDLTIDTLSATRYSLSAYLPPGSLPDGYRLPEFFKGRGTLKGPLNDLEIAIGVATGSDRTQVEIAGQVRQLLQTDSLYFDLQVPALVIDIPELMELLPEGTLPTDLNLPDFRISQGWIKGYLDDLSFRLPIATTNGRGLIQGKFAAEDFDLAGEITGFQLDKLFQGARADSLSLLKLEPLNLTVETSGQLRPYLDGAFHLTIYEGVKGVLMNLYGTAVRDTFSGEMTFSHTDLQGSANAVFIHRDSVPEVRAEVQLERADLERWHLSDRPLYLSGQGKFSTKGLDVEDLSARLDLNDILLRSSVYSAFIDSLYGYAELHNGINEAEIFSDFLNFSLEGKFRPRLVIGEIKDFIQAYWQEEIPQPDPVVYGNYLKAYLEIINPEPLTSGIIPGLKDLSSMRASFIYREKEPELVLTGDLPHLNYSGIIMDSLLIDTRGSQGRLSYQADWKNINLFDQVILGNTRLSGKNTAEALAVNFQVWDDQQDLIHHLQLEVDPEPDSFMLQLGPQQLIDTRQWQIPANNRILFAGKKVDIRNWRLDREDQILTLRAPHPNEILINLGAIDISPFGKLIRSKEETVAGVMDGSIIVTDPLEQPKFEAHLSVTDLHIYNELWGDFSLNLNNINSEAYDIDLQLKNDGNEISLAGVYAADGKLDLRLNIGALQLEVLEPLSFGYLSRAEGHLMGEILLGGTVDNPSYQGQLQLVDAALDLNLLKTRFRIENEAIRFQGQTINFDNLSFYDPQNNEAVLSGTIIANSLTDYRFDLQASARDFLVLNTQKEDNPLYYGYLRADADVLIKGDLYQPEVTVTASRKINSHITYNMNQNSIPQEESRVGVVRFVDKFEWEQTILSDSLETVSEGRRRSFSLTTTLNVTPDLLFTVLIDPLTGDQFTGRGEGDIIYRQYPDGKMEMTGRIEMVEGLYDFTYQGLINRQFSIEQGSSISWQGNPMNPTLDLSISSLIKASPYPLVQEFSGAEGGNLRQQQTFAVMLYLKGTLENMEVTTDILYPEDVAGNSGLPAIDQSLFSLRNNKSQLNTQAFGLLLFKGFVTFGNGTSNGIIDESVQSGLDNVLSHQLNNLANRYISFVELDFGMESFNNSQGGRQRDLRLSLRKRLFNDRLIISIDGVTQTGASNDNSSLPQSYLDNLTAEFLLSKNGTLRLKIFSDRDYDQFSIGDVIRVGGHLAFSKDFNRFFWSSDKKPARKTAPEKPGTDDGTRESEQTIKIEQH